MVDPSCPEVLKYRDRAKLGYITVHCRDCGMMAGPFYEANRAMVVMGTHNHKGVYSSRHNGKAPLPEQVEIWETEHIKFCRRCFEFSNNNQRGESVDNSVVDMLIERYLSGMSAFECANRVLHGLRVKNPLRECIETLRKYGAYDLKSLTEGTQEDQSHYLTTLRDSLKDCLARTQDLDQRMVLVETIDSIDSALPTLISR